MFMLGVGQQDLCDQVVLSMVYIFWKQSSSMMQKFGSWQTQEGTHAAVNSHSYQNRFKYLQQKNWIVFFPECLTKGKDINDVFANTMDILSIPIYSINSIWCVNLCFFLEILFSSPVVLVGKSRTLMLGNKAKYCWLDVCNSKLWGIGSKSLAACGKWWVSHRGPSGFLEISRFTLCSGGTVPWNLHLSRHQNLICNMNHNIHARSFLQRKQNPPFLCLPTKSSFPLITSFQHYTSTSDIAKPISLYKFNIHPPRTEFRTYPKKISTPCQIPLTSSKKLCNLEMQKVTCIFISSNLESNNPS